METDEIFKEYFTHKGKYRGSVWFKSSNLWFAGFSLSLLETEQSATYCSAEF